MNKEVLSPWGSCLVPCGQALKSTYSVKDMVHVTINPNTPFGLKSVFEMQCFQGKFTHQTLTAQMKLCEPGTRKQERHGLAFFMTHHLKTILISINEHNALQETKLSKQ